MKKTADLKIPNTESTLVNLATPLTYIHFQKSTAAPLLLLFHGYTDSALSFLKRIHTAMPSHFEILAPNGLFPQPQRIDNSWKEAYAWYFADLSAKQIVIHPEVSAQGILQLLGKLDLLERPKILCGFSQGGYFLPFIANQLSKVQHLITIGSGFRMEDYRDFNLKIPLHSIHGDADEIIPFLEAKAQFEKIKMLNPQSEFHSVQEMGHTINENGCLVLSEILQNL